MNTRAASAATVVRVRWRPWRIPFRDPLTTGAGDFTERAGVLVQIETADGATSLGEAAPLPATGLDVADCADRLAEIAPSLLGKTPDKAWAALPPTAGNLATVDVAVKTAFAGLLAHARGEPLANWLAREAGLPAPHPAPVPANALLSSTTPAAIAREAADAVASGFETVKVKVGRDHARDSALLRAVREAVGGETAIRIDANGAWGEQEALAALGAHAARGVALCEQPLAPTADAPERLARVRAASTIPIAADESVRSLEDLRALLAANAIDAVVVKPLRTGLREALAIVAEAVARDLPCIVTTTFDTGVGTALALQLAALLPEPRPACGLATLPLLAGDVVSGCPDPEAGAIPLPSGPGLGVSIDCDALDRFATAPWQEARA